MAFPPPTPINARQPGWEFEGLPPGQVRVEFRYQCGHVYVGTVIIAKMPMRKLVRWQGMATLQPCPACSRGTTIREA